MVAISKLVKWNHLKGWANHRSGESENPNRTPRRNLPRRFRCLTFWRTSCRKRTPRRTRRAQVRNLRRLVERTASLVRIGTRVNTTLTPARITTTDHRHRIRTSRTRRQATTVAVRRRARVTTSSALRTTSRAVLPPGTPTQVRATEVTDSRIRSSRTRIPQADTSSSSSLRTTITTATEDTEEVRQTQLAAAPVITPVKDTPGEVVPSPNTINLILPTTTRTSRASNSIEAIATTTTLAATVTATQDLKATANTRQAAGNLNRRAIQAMEVTEVIRTVEGRRATTDKRTVVVVLAGNILDISNSSSSSNRRIREANRCRVTMQLELVLEVLGITLVDMRVMLPTIIITASSTMRVVRVTTTTTVTVLRELSPRRDPATPRKTLKNSPDLRQSQRRRRRRHLHHNNNHHKPETRLDHRKRSINLRHNMAPRQAECSHRSYPATTNNRARVHREVPSATTTTSTITMPRWRSLRKRPPECRLAIVSHSTTRRLSRTNSKLRWSADLRRRQLLRWYQRTLSNCQTGSTTTRTRSWVSRTSKPTSSR
uniref:(northern house mosquito) hypothetical protein n=1 Tax=Culex pipiens TaxID=7175 RepID=A0A8D8FCZ6_CULPI